ncbi:NK-tumor recognition protein-like [Salmo trutta]|uniref:NK-tumor recognition protein-like n=1 Tax=Salmo trutta TaxID=8032 RepID=UPI001131CFA5|nr:NK-tumor recognition protein-like [Salmo trutta]
MFGSYWSKVKSKRSKRKHQKLKEKFSWQPLLEFREEEEEEESQKEKRLQQKHSAVKDNPKRPVRGRPGKSPCLKKEDEERIPASPNRNGSVQPTPHSVEDTAEMTKKQRAEPTANSNPKHTKPQDLTANLPKVEKPETVVDAMEICNPEHTDLPEPSPKPPGPLGHQTSTSEHSGCQTQPSTSPREASGPRAAGPRVRSGGPRGESASRSRAGCIWVSLFDEVRRTANQDSSSSEERSPSKAGARGEAEQRRPSHSHRSRSSSGYRSYNSQSDLQ